MKPSNTTSSQKGFIICIAGCKSLSPTKKSLFKKQDIRSSVKSFPEEEPEVTELINKIAKRLPDYLVNTTKRLSSIKIQRSPQSLHLSSH